MEERGQWWDRTTWSHVRAGARLAAVSRQLCPKCPLSHRWRIPGNDQEFSQGVNNSKKELSQNWECLTAHTIWVKPLHPEVSQDPHTGPQERCSCPSSTATEAAGEAGDLHSASLALQVPWTPSWQLLLWLELLRKRRTMSLSLLQWQQFPQSLMSRREQQGQRTRSQPYIALLA